MGVGIDVKGIGEGVSSVFTGVGALIQTIKGGVTPDKQAELLAQAQQIEASANLAQAEINKVEASGASLFVAGWRPAVGWICAFGLAYAVILKPFFEFIANLFGYAGSFPTIEGDILNTTLWGMLGLGIMRTAEKITGSSGKH